MSGLADDLRRAMAMVDDAPPRRQCLAPISPRMADEVRRALGLELSAPLAEADVIEAVAREFRGEAAS